MIYVLYGGGGNITSSSISTITVFTDHPTVVQCKLGNALIDPIATNTRAVVYKVDVGQYTITDNTGFSQTIEITALGQHKETIIYNKHFIATAGRANSNNGWSRAESGPVSGIQQEPSYTQFFMGDGGTITFSRTAALPFTNYKSLLIGFAYSLPTSRTHRILLWKTSATSSTTVYTLGDANVGYKQMPSSNGFQYVYCIDISNYTSLYKIDFSAVASDSYMRGYQFASIALSTMPASEFAAAVSL